MDLSKAFDSVSHNKLIDYLNQIGIKHKALALFTSYLENRSHKVQINSIKSSSKHMSQGLPQGTVLSPLLYIIYVIGLSKLQIEGNLYSYADDTALIVTGETWESVAKIAENSLKKIINWFSNNNLTLNNNKTVFLTFSNSIKTTTNISNLKAHDPLCQSIIQCKCPVLHRVNNTKYLGITFDQHLRWNNYISELNLKLRRLYAFYNMAKQFLNLQWLKNTYFALSQSIIEYGIVVWGGAAHKYISGIQVAQNTSLKIIYRKPRLYPSKQLHTEMKILSVKKLYFKKNLYYLSQNNIPQTVAHNYNTRSENLVFPKINTAKFYNSYLITGLRVYEKLPTEIKNCQQFAVFKLLVKRWLMKEEIML